MIKAPLLVVGIGRGTSRHGTGNYVKVVDGRVAIVNAIKVQQALTAYRNREMQSSLEMIPVTEFGE